MISIRALLTCGLLASALLISGFVASQDPAKLAGYGAPELVKKQTTGWATIKFKDLGITIDLPNWPTPATMAWDEDSSKTTKAWSGYDFESRKLSGDIYVYEAVDAEGFRAEDSRDQEIEGYDDEQTYGNVKTTKREATIGGKQVLILDITYLDGIDEAVGRCYFWEEGNKVGSMRLTWWKEDEAAALKIADHIEQSLKFTK